MQFHWAKRLLFVGLWCCLVVQVQAGQSSNHPLTLDLRGLNYQLLADKIFKNEANRNPDYLTHWNNGEDFPSLGIGHFIWLTPHAKKAKVVFEETFPQMFAFVSAQMPAPLWLSQLNPFEVPWKNKAEFDQAWSKKDLVELRKWLLKTQQWQAEFIVSQFLSKWHNRLDSLPVEIQQSLSAKLSLLLESEQGLYAVIDYFNFKGLGFNAKEQYQGKGWGLMDVLSALPANISKADALSEFIKQAKTQLQQRVELSPPERHEQKWLKGWFKRLEGYNN